MQAVPQETAADGCWNDGEPRVADVVTFQTHPPTVTHTPPCTRRHPGHTPCITPSQHPPRTGPTAKTVAMAPWRLCRHRAAAPCGLMRAWQEDPRVGTAQTRRPCADASNAPFRKATSSSVPLFSVTLHLVFLKSLCLPNNVPPASLIHRSASCGPHQCPHPVHLAAPSVCIPPCQVCE